MREGLRCRRFRLLCRILPGSFRACQDPSTSAGDAVALGAVTAIPAGAGNLPAAPAAVPVSSSVRRILAPGGVVVARPAMGPTRRSKKRPWRRSPSPGPSSRCREKHYRASSGSSEEDRADASPPRAGRAPGGTPGDFRSSREDDRSPRPGTSRSFARGERYRPGAGRRSPAPSGAADDDRSSALESVDFDRDD